jgi:hypothetical protein
VLRQSFGGDGVDDAEDDGALVVVELTEAGEPGVEDVAGLPGCSTLWVPRTRSTPGVSGSDDVSVPSVLAGSGRYSGGDGAV